MTRTAQFHTAEIEIVTDDAVPAGDGIRALAALLIRLADDDHVTEPGAERPPYRTDKTPGSILSAAGRDE